MKMLTGCWGLIRGALPFALQRRSVVNSAVGVRLAGFVKNTFTRTTVLPSGKTRIADQREPKGVLASFTLERGELNKHA